MLYADWIESYPELIPTTSLARYTGLQALAKMLWGDMGLNSIICQGDYLNGLLVAHLAVTQPVQGVQNSVGNTIGLPVSSSSEGSVNVSYYTGLYGNAKVGGLLHVLGQSKYGILALSIIRRAGVGGHYL